MLQDLLKGKDGLLMLYGLTNGGKTYTAQGTKRNPGLLPRVLDALFDNVLPHMAPRFSFTYTGGVDSKIEPEVREGVAVCFYHPYESSLEKIL